MKMICNTMLTCTLCGFEALELEWDEVWSHKWKGFIAFCCPKCKAIGKSKYNFTHNKNTSGVVLYGLERIRHTINGEQAKNENARTH